MNQYSRLYQDLVLLAKEMGFRVYHKKTPKFAGACVDTFSKKIQIDPIYRNKLKGSVMLAHEIGHWVDLCNGKHLPFFWNADPAPKTIEKVIDEAEWSALEFARKLIKSRNISTKNIPDLNKRYYKKYLLPIWLKMYKKAF